MKSISLFVMIAMLVSCATIATQSTSYADSRADIYGTSVSGAGGLVETSSFTYTRSPNVVSTTEAMSNNLIISARATSGIFLNGTVTCTLKNMTSSTITLTAMPSVLLHVSGFSADAGSASGYFQLSGTTASGSCASYSSFDQSQTAHQTKLIWGPGDSATMNGEISSSITGTFGG